MKGQRVGYVRVSTTMQNTERQLDGVELDRVFEDKASGKDMNRPALQDALAYVREGDVLIVHSLDRLGRSLPDLSEIVATLTKRGVTVEFVKERLVFSGDDSPISQLMFNIMGAFAQFERQLIRERQREGIEQARKRGAYRGRVPKLTVDQVEELKQRVKAGEKKAEIAREYGLSRETVYAYMRQGC